MTTNRKILLLAIVGLLLGVVTWALLPDEDLPAPERGVAVADSNAAAPPPVVAPKPVTSSERLAVRAVDTLLPLPDDVEWSEVRVVDSETGQPVASATVRWFDDEVVVAVADRRLVDPWNVSLEEDHERMATRYGWATTSDEFGIARVQRRAGTTVVARKGSRYGKVDVGMSLLPPRTGFVVELRADHGIEVLVLDANDRPAAGVPIAFAEFQKDGAFHSPHAFGALAVSGRDGRASLSHLQDVYEISDPDELEYRVYTTLPGFERVSVPFDHRAPSTTPLVLKLPPTGVIRVRAAVGERQHPVDRATLADPRGDRYVRTLFGSPFSRRPGSDGWVRFNYVPLKRVFRVVATANGLLIHESIVGPRKPGEVVDAVVTPDTNDVLLAGRLLADGDPVAQRAGELSVSGHHIRSKFKTDRNGRFLVSVRHLRGSFLREISVRCDKAGSPSLVGTLPKLELRTGEQDVGDLALHREALLVSGTCRVDGRPVACQQLVVETWEINQRCTGMEWKVNGDAKLVAHADGRFEFRGVLENPKLRLNVRANDRVMAPIEFAKGQEGVRAELQSATSLAVTMLVPQWCREKLEVKLRRLDGTDETRDAAVQLRVGWRQQADWHALRAGRYEVAIGVAGVAQPLHVVSDVVVSMSAAVDARLVDIDLRHRLRLHRVRVVDGKGDLIPLGTGGVFVHPQPPTGDWRGQSFHRGEVAMLVPTETAELFVGFDGYRPQRVACAGEGQTVKMIAWPRVVVQLPPGIVVPDGCVLRVRLARSDEERSWRGSRWNGALDALMSPRRQIVGFVDGKAEIAVGDDPRSLELVLVSSNSSAAVEMPEQRISSAVREHRLLVTTEHLRAAFDSMNEPSGSKKAKGR